MNQEKRREAIDFIRKLTDKELIDFFYEAVEQRNVYEKTPTGYEKDRWCIVESHFGAFENKEDEEHYSEFCALPADEITKTDWRYREKTIHEQGQCKKCKALIICLSKKAKCPICDELVSCT